jgi:hypothetical protein
VLLFQGLKRKEIPRVGDIWIPKGYTSPNCFIRIFIPRVEKLFQDGDIILKVESGGGTSRLINWRLYVNQIKDLNGN